MNHRDRDILKRLAEQVRTIADRPEMARCRARWKRFNALDPDGPMILCFPEGAWEEILPESTLACTETRARAWERELRMKVFTAEILQDDQPIDGVLNIDWIVQAGTYGVDYFRTQGENRGSYKMKAPLTRFPEDLDKLHFRELSVDRPGTQRLLDEARDVFGDLLEVRVRGGHWWTMGLTWEAIKLIGLEELMIMPYDDPESLHRLMAWLRDEHLNFITWFEREGLLSYNNEADYVGSGGIGYTDELPGPSPDPDGPVRLLDRWGFAESQETIGMSPQMFAEYIFPYQLPLLEKFGLNCYGCCEPVESRWEDLKTIPRLRRLSVSPWSNQDEMAAKLGRNYVFSRKPNPAPVCVDFQEEVIRRDLRETFDKAGACVLEVILKDTHTVENDPTRLARWVAIAREESARHT